MIGYLFPVIPPGANSLVLLQASALGSIGVLPEVPRRFWHCPIAAPCFRSAAVRILSAHQRRNGRPDTAVADLASLARSRGTAMVHRWHELIGTPDWIPAHVLQQHFDAATRAALRHSTTGGPTREWSDSMLQSPLELTAARAGESSWHWSLTHAHWDHIRRCTQFLSRLQFVDRHGAPMPRLTARLEVTRTSIGSRGRSRFTPDLYLDANLAILLDWDGQHAATISFAWTADAKGDEPVLRIRQIQLTQPKGNRWAFQLGDCYFSALLATLCRAAQGIARVQVVRGESLVKLYATDYRNQRREMLGYRAHWSDEDRRRFAELAPKARSYETEIGPRIARLYARTPDGWTSRRRTQGYRELLAA